MKKVISLIGLFTYSLFGTTFKDHLSDYQPVIQKPIVVVITSYNNKEWYKPNLDSIFAQRYSNYRVIYVDDHSQDGTAEYVKLYVTQMNQWHRFTLVENQEWASQMVNHIKAVHMCQDDEIIVHIDGDDWFSYDGVLELLNKIYSKWDIWITYGQYQTWPQNEMGGSRPVPESVIKENKYREFGFYYSHPRTFYAGLFKKIQLKDLIYKGSFIPTAPCPDFMFMFPMLEMAGMHALFIPDILYRWNRINAVSQHNIPVKKDMPPVEMWNKYQPLKSLHENKTSRGCIALVYAHTFQEALQYIERIKKVPGISEFIPVTLDRINELRSLNVYDCEYVLLITDLSKDLPNNLVEIIQTLDTTGARAFFFGLDQTHFIPCNLPINYAPFKGAVIEYRNAPLDNGMLAWQMEYEEYIWQDPALVSQILFAPFCRMSEILSSGDVLKLAFNLRSAMARDRNVALMYQKIGYTPCV